MRISLIIFFAIISLSSTAQQSGWFQDYNKKGAIYGFWGYNRSSYSRSNINFIGQNYNFTVVDAVAKDRPTAFTFKDYFTPASFTIPQYNLRLGYHITKHWSLSLGVDHMKYVMQQDQVAPIEGYIDAPETPFSGVYNRQPMQLTEEFLKFEHTDGLNYISVEAEYNNNLYTFNDKHAINYYVGPSLGMLVPRSNVTLLSKDNYDEFHLAGYGVSGKMGLQFVFWRYVTFNVDSKSGFISMQDILTTGNNMTDRARQTFWFTQVTLALGVTVNLSKE